MSEPKPYWGSIYVPETNPISPKAALNTTLGKGLWKAPAWGEKGKGRSRGNPSPKTRNPLAKPSGPTWRYKCVTSHLALYFSNFLQMRLEHIIKGSNWFGKCLGNSGHGRWSWKSLRKSMTYLTEFTGMATELLLAVQDGSLGLSHSFPTHLEASRSNLNLKRLLLSDLLCKETDLFPSSHYPSPVASLDPNYKLNQDHAPWIIMLMTVIITHKLFRIYWVLMYQVKSFILSFD